MGGWAEDGAAGAAACAGLMAGDGALTCDAAAGGCGAETGILLIQGWEVAINGFRPFLHRIAQTEERIEKLSRSNDAVVSRNCRRRIRRIRQITHHLRKRYFCRPQH